jgi:hypothetical protein
MLATEFPVAIEQAICFEAIESLADSALTITKTGPV